MSTPRRSWRAEEAPAEGGGEHYLSIGDLMAGLLAIFILLVVLFMARLAQDTVEATRVKDESEQAKARLAQGTVEATRAKDESEQAKSEAAVAQRRAEEAERRAKEREQRIEELKARIAQMQDSRREVLVRLREALAAKNVEVEVNEKSGDVTIKENLLFGVNSADLRAEGLTFIENFIPTYAQVIFSEKDFRDSVHRIVVEGHTSCEGTNKGNLNLSLRRAQAVTDHIHDRLYFDKKQELLGKLVTAGRGEADAEQSLCGQNGRVAALKPDEFDHVESWQETEPTRLQKREANRKVVFRFEFKNDEWQSSSLFQNREPLPSGGHQ